MPCHLQRGPGEIVRLLSVLERVPLWALMLLSLAVFALTETKFSPGELPLALALGGFGGGIAYLTALLLFRETRLQRAVLALFWAVFALAVARVPSSPTGEHYRAFRAIRAGATVPDVYAAFPARELAELPPDFTGLVSLFNGSRFDPRTSRFLLVFENGRVRTGRFGKQADLLYRYRAIAPGMTQEEVALLMERDAVEMADPFYQRDGTALPPSSDETGPGWQSYRDELEGLGWVRVQFDHSGVLYKDLVRYSLR